MSEDNYEEVRKKYYDKVKTAAAALTVIKILRPKPNEPAFKRAFDIQFKIFSADYNAWSCANSQTNELLAIKHFTS